MYIHKYDTQKPPLVDLNLMLKLILLKRFNLMICWYNYEKFGLLLELSLSDFIFLVVKEETLISI